MNGSVANKQNDQRFSPEHQRTGHNQLQAEIPGAMLKVGYPYSK